MSSPLRAGAALTVAAALLAGPLLPSASAAPAPSNWTGLAVEFGDTGLLDLDTRPASAGVRAVSGDLEQTYGRRFVSHTEITGAGATVVVTALADGGAPATGFGSGGLVRLGEPTGARRSLALDASVRDQLYVLDQREGTAPALLVTRLHATTGAPDTAFGTAGTVTVPGSFQGASLAVDAFRVLLAANDTSGPLPRGVLLAFGADGTPDPAFGGGDGRVGSPLGEGTVQERVLDVTLDGTGPVVVGSVDGVGVVAFLDASGRPDAASVERQRRTVGDRVDAVVPSRNGVVVASVSGTTGSLSVLGRGTTADGPTTVVVPQGCAVTFPDVDAPGGIVHLLADDGCGRGPRLGHYERDELRRYPRDEIAPELDRLRPVVARRVSDHCVLGDRTGDATGATVGCTGRRPGARFTAVAPARVLDTRTGTGAPRGPLAAGRSLVVDLTGVAGIPAQGVSAVTLNLTAVAPTARGYLTVHPGGTGRPLSSTLSTQQGVTTPTQVTAKLGADGTAVVYNSAGQVHVVADVAGYYTDDPVDLGDRSRFTPVAPRRVLDTRTGTGARPGRVPARTALRLDLAAAGVPAGAEAVTLNLTAVTPTAAGFLTAYPGGTRPLASHLNTRPGVTVPNLVTVKLAADGSVLLYNDQGSVHLVADLAGWYTRGSDDLFTPLPPRRMLDTRTGTGGVRGAVGPAGSVTFPIADSGGVPSGASAVLLTVTAVSPTAATHLTVHPSTSARPTSSNLNVAAGTTQANQVVVPLGADGDVTIANHDGTTHLVADVAGYFFLDERNLTG